MIDPILFAAIAVGVALGFIVLQHLTVLGLQRHIFMPRFTIEEVAEGRAKIGKNSHGEVHIRQIRKKE